MELITHTDNSVVNPTFDSVTTDEVPICDWTDAFINRIKCDNVHACTYELNSAEELFDMSYKTDPHFNMQGALATYGAIADLASLKYYDPLALDSITVKESWIGSYAREGRYLGIVDPFDDFMVDFSDLTYYALDDDDCSNPVSNGMREGFMSGEKSSDDIPASNTYAKYFGTDDCQIINSGSNNGRTLLLVGDSYVFPLRDYFASNYAHSVMVFPGNNDCSSNLDELIEKYDADDVIIMMHSLKVNAFHKRSPHFFS